MMTRDTSELIDVIVAHCPNLCVEQLEPLGEGDFCHAYTVNGTWVVRFAKHLEAAQSLRREACLLSQVGNQLDLPIPKPQYYDDAGGTELAFVKYPKLSGVALTQGRFLSLPDEARDRCAGQLAQFVVQLHDCDLQLAKRCTVPRCDYQTQYTQILLRAKSTLFPLLEAHEQHYVETTITEYLSNRHSIMFEPVLLHGDLSPDHVLYDIQNMHVSGIIDFGDMMIGDPAWDLTYLYEDYGVEFLSYFLRHYPASDLSSLLARVHRFHELDAIEWTVGAVKRGHISAVRSQFS